MTPAKPVAAKTIGTKSKCSSCGGKEHHIPGKCAFWETAMIRQPDDCATCEGRGYIPVKPKEWHPCKACGAFGQPGKSFRRGKSV